MIFNERSLIAATGAFVCAVIAALPSGATYAGERPQPGRGADAAGEDTDSQAVATLMQRYCFDCHAADTQEAGLRFDTLDFSFENERDHEILQAVWTAAESGAMPPEEANGPSRDERQFLTTWLARRLGETAAARRRSGHWTRNRRLTVEEYNYTMQSLFGVDAQFASSLPPDPISRDGYRNDSELLTITPLQMECYLDAARQAVARYVPFGQTYEQPLRYHVEFEELYYTTADRYGTREQAPQPVAQDQFAARRAANSASPSRFVGPLTAIPPGPFPTAEELRAAIPKLHQQFIAFPACTTVGEMIIRIRAAATPDRYGRYPRMRVESGITLGDGDSMDTRVLGEIDVTAPLDEPAVYEFRIRVEDVPSKGPLSDEQIYDRLSVFDMVQVFISNVTRDPEAIYALGRGGVAASDATSRRVKAPLEQMAAAGVNALYLDCIELEMLPGLTRDGAYPWTVDAAVSAQGLDEQSVYVADLLNRFMQRAYRRPPSPEEVAHKVELFASLRQRGFSFEESLRDALTAVLVSPAFLFLEGRFPIGDHPQRNEWPLYTLASRLSYLLWQGPPDARLMRLAEDGSLADREVYAGEAARMLVDPRSRRFLESFCRQWLRLDKFDNVAVSPDSHPEYDGDLADAMVQETLHYFVEVFTSGSSALELVESDFAVLNDRLAKHYGLDGVVHGDFRRVALPEGSIRGGLLTQASVLTMNSNGVDSHPVRRGAWLLDRMLGTPPPPPPANAPEIDEENPDFRGLSLKERIELHRQADACRNCHEKIDPWGIAFENFGAVGRWRDEIHSGAKDHHSHAVDAVVQLPDGVRIDGIRDLKRYLSQRRSEQFTKALTHHMMTYALGRSLDFADRHQVEAVHGRFASAEYQLKELVLAIVDSEAFRQ